LNPGYVLTFQCKDLLTKAKSVSLLINPLRRIFGLFYEIQEFM